MNHIHKAIAILGITSLLNGMPATVYAQAQQPPLMTMNFQQYF